VASATELEARSAGIQAWITRHAEAILLTAIGIALASKLALAFRINVHWDEFYFLSLVWDYVRGELSTGLQTFHVHLFSWLPRLDGEIREIIAARLVMAVLAAGSAGLIYGIVRRVVPRGAALFAVLSYLSLSVVIEHGSSFRTDPIATFFGLLALFLLMRQPGNAVAAALCGAALAIAALITIKVAFFLPVVAGIIWCQVPSLRAQMRVLVASGGACALVFGALYLLHLSSLAAPEAAGALPSLGGIASKVLVEDGLFARWPDLLLVIGFNPLFWIMTAEGAATICRSAWKTRRRDEWLPLVLALPALTPLIYRNAFHYYYPLILAPAAILAAVFYEKHRLRALTACKSQAVGLFPALLIIQCGFLALHLARNLPNEIAPQRSVLAAAHEVFPEPVPYIGGYGVVASFPRQGFFMSSWGVENYRRSGVPIFPELVARTQPPMLLADSPSLYGAMMPGVIVTEDRALLPADVRFLKDNYIQHWGMLFVAGKRLAIPAGDTAAFDIVIAGEYRLEAAAPVSLDGRALRPGDVVTLAGGQHAMDASGGPTEVVLRWAKALPPPPEPPVGLLTFFGVSP
jgi:hypothetical protein